MSTLSDFFDFRHDDDDDSAAQEQAAIREELAKVTELQAQYPEPSIHLQRDAKKAGVSSYLTSAGWVGDYLLHKFDVIKIANAQREADMSAADFAAMWNKRRDAAKDW